jgi:DNA-directed RNA polymerase specialized sigma24 family protein
MNARTSLRPWVAADAGDALTPDQRIAIDPSRSPGERAEALFLAIGPQLGRHLAARYPVGSVDIADVVGALWIKVLGHITTFRNLGDTEVSSWHQLRSWFHAMAVNEAGNRAGVMTRRNAARLAPVQGIRTGSSVTAGHGRT